MSIEQDFADRGWPSFARVASMVQVSPGVWVPAGDAHACQPGRWWVDTVGARRCFDCGAAWVSGAVEGEGPGQIGSAGE